MLSTWVLVKHLKGSDPVSETASLGNIFMSSFLKREMPHQVMGIFVGVPWPEIIMKHSVYIQVRFGSKQLDLVWVRGRLIRPEQRNNEQRHYQPDPVSLDNLLPAETQTRSNYTQSVTRSPSSLDVLTTSCCCVFVLFPMNLLLARSGHT